MICIINHLGWRRRESKTEYDSPPTLGLVGSGGVSSKVPTIYDYVSPSSEPVTSERLAVGCSTVATALDALRDWNRDASVANLRRLLLELLCGLEAGESE